MIRFRTFLSSLICAAFFAAAFVFPASAKDIRTVAPEKVGLSSERLKRLDAAMQAEIDAGKKAGVVTLIARHGRIAHHKAYGMASLEEGVAMRTDHLFRLYSMTKPITSVALLMLYEEGKFQLTDPLEKYIPAFKDVKVFAGLDDAGNMILEEPRRKITIHDVFRHTAGFSYAFGNGPVDEAYRKAGIDFAKLGSMKEMVDILATMPLLYHPGERWEYSVAHDVQGYLVEYFSGQPFERFMRERIFEPLAMKDAVFGIPASYVPRYTTNYAPKEGGGLKPIDVPGGGVAGDSPFGGYARYGDHPFGGLSLSSTSMDYLRFSQMLLNGGALDGVRILGKKTVELMTSDNLPPQLNGLGFMGSASGYGLGVSVLKSAAGAGTLGSASQFGWGGAATTWVIIDPVEDMIGLLFTQVMPTDMGIVQKFQTLMFQSVVE